MLNTLKARKIDIEEFIELAEQYRAEIQEKMQDLAQISKSPEQATKRIDVLKRIISLGKKKELIPDELQLIEIASKLTDDQIRELELECIGLMLEVKKTEEAAAEKADEAKKSPSKRFIQPIHRFFFGEPIGMTGADAKSKLIGRLADMAGLNSATLIFYLDT
jgi:hypothetical protein